MSGRPARESPEARLARLGFTDVAAAARGIAAIVGDEPDRRVTDDLVLELAQAADPDLAVRSLARLVDGSGASTGDLRRSLVDDRLLTRRITRVLGGSSALADHFARHPDDWHELADPDLDRVRPTAAAIAAELRAAGSPEELRRTYRRLLVRLAARDLTGALRVDDAAGELADLAAGTIDAALGLAMAEAGNGSAPYRLAVVGMGKCGGRELNYVSDVDVLFVAEASDAGQEAAALRTATAAASAMMRICSDHTLEGTLWPVDAALRPEGTVGQLVRTLHGYETYYGRWASTWEFQALLKARPIAGDRGLADRFISLISPLVWSAADRVNFVDDVQAMRRRVVDQLSPEQAAHQLKLGPGGLRDIEFAVQLLQLVHGRSDPDIRQANTWQALDALTRQGYVGREDGARLTAAYGFLRTLEHRLQLSHLRRTHVLPTEPSEVRALGRSLGLMADPVGELTRQWQQHSRDVKRLHEKLFYRPLLGAVAALPTDQARLTTEAARKRLVALGYADPAGALRHLEALTGGLSRSAAIQRALLPVLLGWFADAPDPDSGLLSFRRLSDALGSSPFYLRMLRDEGTAAERLARLLATGRYAIDLLMRAPEAAALLPQDAELQPRPVDELAAEATALATRQSTPEEAALAVRALRRRELFRVAAADIVGLLDVSAVGEAVSAVTAATVQAGLTAATTAVESDRADQEPPRLAVIAMGRLGGSEMSYGSDADVLFVYEPLPGQDDRSAQEAASAVATELRRLLAAPGPDPGLSVDAGLRPEGRQGPLVRSMASYAAYYARWSSIWESQALLRAAPLAGDGDVAARFLELVDPLRYPVGGLSPADITEVRRIKARVDAERLPRGVDRRTHVKLGPGGIADVEWTVQLLQLRHAEAQPALRTTQTLGALAAAAHLGLVAPGQAQALAESWRLATRLRNASMLVRGRQSDTLPTASREDAGVAWLCGYGPSGGGRLVDDYRRTARRAAQVVEAVFWS
ncbi:MAG: bifunctional [glutamine synthetase] adenylyltransferase/[glutamine synthetase]-adenylyl-L-tyrosine phosphorylase [Nocardioidaceae bacterium]